MRTDESGTPAEYPIEVTAEVPPQSSRLLAVTGILFIKGILLLPHLIVIWFLQVAALLVAWIGYWVILFTGRLPEGLHGFITGVQRWNTRLNGWLFSLTDSYPPFSLGGGSEGEQTGPSRPTASPNPPA
jgi:Domain of unknown function (DUF4389)